MCFFLFNTANYFSFYPHYLNANIFRFAEGKFVPDFYRPHRPDRPFLYLGLGVGRSGRWKWGVRDIDSNIFIYKCADCKSQNQGGVRTTNISGKLRLNLPA
jgi:hypothetical protein